MFELRSVFVVQLNYLFNRVAQKEVVVRLVLDFQIVRFELDFLNGLISFDWGTLLTSDDLLDWWINYLLQVGLVVGNQFFCPLSAIFYVINHLDLVKHSALQSL